MPGGDKTGPIGEGPMTGRQMGCCGQKRNRVLNDEQVFVPAQGMGCRRRFGQGRGNQFDRGKGHSFGRNS